MIKLGHWFVQKIRQLQIHIRVFISVIILCTHWRKNTM